MKEFNKKLAKSESKRLVRALNKLPSGDQQLGLGFILGLKHRSKNKAG